MNEQEFSGLFRDLISHLYDYASLEMSPLTEMVIPPYDFQGRRGEYLRILILQEIERFRPNNKEFSWHSIEWRPYNILKNRYVEGTSSRDLAERLALSERQLRRDNSRALRALTGRMRERLTAMEQDQFKAQDDVDDESPFDAELGILELSSLVEGVTTVLANRIALEGRELLLEGVTEPILVVADRIIVRQILISLTSFVLGLPSADAVSFRIRADEDNAEISIRSGLAEKWTQDDEDDLVDLTGATSFWGQRLNAVIEESHPALGELGDVVVTFRLPLAKQRVILVVDDQKPTHQMFRRFLSRTVYQIVGVTNSAEALARARQLQPALITLDVMIPKVDGWEILQALKTDSETREIPVLVCSAWAEPELAKSLGAAGFLKKPVMQRDLFAALGRLGL
jgi:CheY-like chemotaxis protein